MRRRHDGVLDSAQSVDLFRSVFDDGPMGAAMVDVAADPGRLIRVNRKLCAMLKRGSEQISDYDLAAIVHPDDRSAALHALMRLTPSTGASPLIRLIRSSGHELLTQLHMSLVGGSVRSPPQLAIVQVEDVTLRERTVTALRASQKQLQDIVDNVPAMIVAKDLRGRYILVNRRAFEIAGIRTGDTDFNRFALDDARQYIEADQQVLSSEHAIQVEEIVWHGSEPHTYLSLKFVLADETGEPYGVGIVATDITDLKQAETAATVAQHEAERANQAKSEFLSRLSHELRTPLNSILCYSQLQPSPVPEGIQSNLDHISAAGEHLLALISEVLDLSKIEQGVQRMAIKPVHACEPLKAAVEIVRSLAAVRDIQIDCDFHAGLYQFVLADCDRLKQVLLNILVNGIKYNRDGGILRVSLHPASNGRMRFLISDTGPGVPPDDIPRIFAPFEQLNGPDDSTDGVGLGLAVSKALTEAMNGQIGVERTGVQEGATFFVELPRCPAPKDADDVVFMTAKDRKFPELVSVIDAPTPATILCIEDDVASLGVVRQAIAKIETWDFVPAMKGKVGLALAAEREPDVILLDLHLPDIPGRDVLRRLKAQQQTKHIPVIVLSADASAHNITGLRSAGADDYLTKPIDLEAFVHLLDATVRR